MPLIMHRTRNRGVIGVKGQYTKGPYYSSGAVTRKPPVAAPMKAGKTKKGKC